MKAPTNHRRLSELLMLVICQQTQHKLHAHTFRVQIVGKIASHEPTEIPMSSAISRTVNLLLLRTMVLTLSFPRFSMLTVDPSGGRFKRSF